jgi:hypothetical protein
MSARPLRAADADRDITSSARLEVGDDALEAGVRSSRDQRRLQKWNPSLTPNSLVTL